MHMPYGSRKHGIRGKTLIFIALIGLSWVSVTEADQSDPKAGNSPPYVATNHENPSSTDLSPRVRINFDRDWRFFLGDAENAQAPQLDDHAWRGLDLPHDWSIELTPSKDEPSGYSGGYYPCGVGWYRKSFRLPADWAGKNVFIEFDGVFMNSDVYLNGRHLGHRTNGYIGFEYDLTPWLKADGDNVLAVRVNNKHQPHERWYTGSGIYRHVWLTATADLYVTHWGTSITTPEISEQSARAVISTQIANATARERRFRLEIEILDQQGRSVASVGSEVSIPGRSRIPAAFVEHTQEVMIEQPRLWGLRDPHLYRAVTRLVESGVVRDVYETTFGVRSVEFNVEKGFVLNGTPVKMKGVCIHHDAGCLGAAAPDRVWERRLQILKEMGCNAVRLSHNPHSPVLLDLCDRMGLLVYNECFDKWNRYTDRETGEIYWDFVEIWPRDLGDFLRRDRNHPSVVIWSVGNEVDQQTFDVPAGVRILKQLVDYVHRVEPTRKVTCALRPNRMQRQQDTPREPSLMAHFMDVVSLNYQTQMHGLYHLQYPEMIIIDSETLPWYVNDLLDLNVGEDVYPTHHTFLMHDYVAGQFVWAGIDYLGEAGLWPNRGWASGLIDTCGFRKPVSYYTQSRYSSEPMVYLVVMDESGREHFRKPRWGWPPMASHWNWPEGKSLKVVAFTNCASVELFVNGRSVGERLPADFVNGIPHWRLPFEPGSIKVVGRYDGRVVAEHELTTAGAPAKVVLVTDRATLNADGRDVAHITAMVTDAAGNRVPDAEHLIAFEIEGPGKIIGVDNGDLDSLESYRDSKRQARRGRCLAIVQTTDKPGRIILQARSTGLKEGIVTIPTIVP